jgi:hypothetical protein
MIQSFAGTPSMPHLRMTTRRWLVLIALIAVCLVAVQTFRAIAWDRHRRAVDEFWNKHPGIDPFHLEGSNVQPPPRPWWVSGP